MAKRGNAFFKGGIYHVYNRGQNLFLSHERYSRCIELFQKYSEQYRISIIVYCLMPNHYHFLLEQNDDIPISKLIGTVFNQYVQYANLINANRGPLFEGRFKHIFVDKDEYYQSLCSYIHLNPVSAGLVSNPGDWKYSDYADWVTGKSPYLKNYFSSGRDYMDFVLENQQLIPTRYKID